MQQLQRDVDKVVEQRDEGCLNLGAAMCEATFFSLANTESGWSATIAIGECNYHRSRICGGGGVDPMNLFGVLSGTMWGWHSLSFANYTL